MKERWRQAFLAWAQTDEHAQRLEAAHHRIAAALQACTKPYVAFSGGKDSTALLHLVLQHKPDVTVLHWDFGPFYMPRSIEYRVRKNAYEIGAQNLRIESSALYRKYRRTAINVWGRVFYGRLIKQLAAEGFDCAFVGIRAEESARRKRRREQVHTGIREVFPLFSWTWMDVWAYIVKNNLPYLAFYDQRAPIVGYENVRFTTLFDPEFAPIGADALDNITHWWYRHIPQGMSNSDSSQQ